MAVAVRAGIYRHYKGNLYRVLEVATHSETGEKLVVYRPLYGERALWVRPLEMFAGSVVVDGQVVPRFAWHAAAGEETSPATGRRDIPAVEPGRASPPSATASDQPLETVQERVQRAMSAADKRPDLSSVPLFENRDTALKLGAAAAVVLLLLGWIVLR